MEKLNVYDKAAETEMYTKYESAYKKRVEEAEKKLTDEQRKFIERTPYRGIAPTCELRTKLVKGLMDGTYKKPSEFYEKECGWLFGDIILDSYKDIFIYTVDSVTKHPYTDDYVRRPFRSADYVKYIDHLNNILNNFRSFHVPKTLPQRLRDELTDEERVYLKRSLVYWKEYEAAYYIDKGDKTVIEWASNVLDSGNTEATSRSAFKGVFMSENTELHKKAADLLLAARLQEGLRQAICECCDEGTMEAFKTILGCIKEADLIRFSSVKRAVATWTGIMSAESADIDRIGKKEFELIYGCLSDEKFRDECLASDDAMKCYTGLWALTVIETDDAVKKVDEFIENGSHQQILTAALFSVELFGNTAQQVAHKLIMSKNGEHDVMALALQNYLDKNGKKWMDFTGGQADKAMDGYFNDRKEAEDAYEVLKEMRSSMTKKEEEFSPIVFPWLSAKLTKSTIVKKMVIIASLLGDNDKIDETAGLLSEISAEMYDSRWWYVSMILDDPKTEKQLDALVECCADRESYTSERSFALVEKVADKLTQKHFTFFENMLRYKKADVRANTIKMLMKQSDDSLYECIDRLIGDKKEEKRTGALDLIMQLGKDGERKDICEKCLPLIEKIEKPTSKEKILIDSIRSTDAEEEQADLNYGLFTDETSYTPEWDKDFIAECQKKFMEYFPNSAMCGGKPKETENDMIGVLKKLADFIHEHRNDEYDGYGGEAAVLGNASSIYRWYDNEKKPIFCELWDEFCEKEKISQKQVVRLKIYTDIQYQLKRENIGEDKAYYKLTKKLYGPEFVEACGLPYIELMSSVVRYMESKIGTEPDINVKIKYAIYEYYCNIENTDELYDFEPSQWNSFNYYVSGGEVKDYKGGVTLQAENIAGIKGNPAYLSDEKTRFAMNIRVAEKLGTYVMIADEKADTEGKKYSYNRKYFRLPDVISYIKAAENGIITKEYLYKHLFCECPDLKEVMNILSEITGTYRELGQQVTSRRHYYRNYGNNLLGDIIGSKERVNENALTDEDRKKAEYAVEIYETMANIILDKELKRGDSPTEFSESIVGFKRIYGMDRFVHILAAMGKDTIDRSTYYYGRGVSRKQSLSHMLGICMPEEGDNAEKLRELLSKTDVTEKRVVEAAMFAPQWMDIIQDYLGWDGFRSACYYFIAHMNEYIDDSRKAVIAKYTPIPTEELREGAFDINWFREALETVGQERFDMIYDSAKYISDGGKHSRARKYADAVMGRLDKAESLKNIEDKRNKDTLMAYGLIPFENDDDIVERYLVFTKFLKDSKKFGAQRRASEANAVERAMQNMALNAGYDDTMRLTLRMETRLFDSIRELTEFNEIDDIKIRLVIGEDGKTAVECVKGDKPLKSVPAKYKKNETVVRINEVKKQLTDQYRRTRQMLEQSMEDRTEFTAQEISILSGNPVIQPIFRDLVWMCGKDMGFMRDMALVGADGKKKKLKDDSKLIIAHPYDMYSAGVWRDYQKYLFDNQIAQTFKQVFRELYVKTDEELEMLDTRRYSGNQIQPKQTMGCLKGRRWVADVEDGLQKIFYKENIIATIYALADWFSPSEIEAPTLEWVQFFDRKTGEPIKIKDIPDVIFSEVMRDVDLAVSVAHAGQVDPETSHSTIEMRRALCEFTLLLFKLDNVTFNKNHALITGKRADYLVHLGSGVVHIQGGAMINILPVHSQHRGKIFLPFADEDPKTAQILTEILLFAEDEKIKDPFILDQIK